MRIPLLVLSSLLVSPTVAQQPALQLRASTTQELRVPSSPGAAFTVDVVLAGRSQTLVLAPHSIRAPNFEVLLDEGGVLRRFAAPASDTYRGTVAGAGGSLVAAQLIGGSLRAWIDVAGEVWNVQPARELRPGAPATQHVVYRNADVVQDGVARCGVDTSMLPPAPRVSGGADASMMTLQRAEIAIDADYDLLQVNFGDVVGTLQVVTALFNIVDAIYRRDVGITYAVTTIIIRLQPIYTSRDLGQLLGEFRNYWNANHGNIPRDVAHLLTGKPSPNGVIGVAYLGVICSGNSGYGLSIAHFIPNGTTAALIAHELGHNWNAPHCNSANPCNIMCSTLGGCSGNLSAFAPVSQAAITSYRNSRSCLQTISDGPAGTFTAFGSGCLGSNGTPRHLAFGFPRVEGTGWFRVFEAPGHAAVFLALGLSNQSFGGLALPLDLGVIGAPNCLVLNDHVVIVSGNAGFAGRHTIEVDFPASANMIGVSLYSQFLCVDAAANLLGLTTSNAYETVLGR